MAYARVWHIVDAKERVLGRMATGIATTLMGKHKPIYDPAGKIEHFSGVYFLLADCGDYVVVINAKHVKVTGRKAEQKVYRSHSGFPGGLKEIPYKTMLEKNPEQVD